jgi:hypothetical protein
MGGEDVKLHSFRVYFDFLSARIENAAYKEVVKTWREKGWYNDTPETEISLRAEVQRWLESEMKDVPTLPSGQTLGTSQTPLTWEDYFAAVRGMGASSGARPHCLSLTRLPEEVWAVVKVLLHVASQVRRKILFTSSAPAPLHARSSTLAPLI